MTSLPRPAVGARRRGDRETPCSTTPGSRRGPWSAATGEAAIADDTGLEVEALGGRARACTRRATRARRPPTPTTWPSWSQALAGSRRGPRRARFRTVAVAAWPDGQEIVAEGAVDGAIAVGARGDGWVRLRPGVRPDRGRRADLRGDEPGREARWSHRGRAFRALACRLAGLS